ncbi:tape measure protein [bacterium]|nr:tape measure protein [bacterium]
MRKRRTSCKKMTSTYVQLKAMGLDPVAGSMQAIADMTSMLGGRTEVLDTIVNSIGKAYSKGKLQIEEMTQMMARGVPVARLLADMYGTNEAAIMEMASEGELGRDVIENLIVAIEHYAGGSSQAMVETFAGKWSLVQDEIAKALDTLAKGGLLDAATAGLGQIVTTLEDLSDSGILEDLGKSMGDWLMVAVELAPKLLESIQTILAWLYEYRDEIVDIGKLVGVIWGISKVMGFAAAVGKVTIAVTGASSVLKIAAAGMSKYAAEAALTSSSAQNLVSSTGQIGKVAVGTGQKLITLSTRIIKVQGALILATAAGYGLSKWFDTWNQLSQKGMDYGEVDRLKAFNSALKELHTSVAEGAKVFGVSAAALALNAEAQLALWEAEEKGFATAEKQGKATKKAIKQHDERVKKIKALKEVLALAAKKEDELAAARAEGGDATDIIAEKEEAYEEIVNRLSGSLDGLIDKLDKTGNKKLSIAEKNEAMAAVLEKEEKYIKGLTEAYAGLDAILEDHFNNNIDAFINQGMENVEFMPVELQILPIPPDPNAYEKEELKRFFKGLGDDLGQIQGLAMADGIIGSLFGEEDSFYTAFVTAGENSAVSFIDAFIEAWGGGQGLDAIFDDLQTRVDAGQISAGAMKAIGTVLNYASAAMAAYQSWDKPMDPVERGLLGAQVGSVAGPWGALIGGILGLLHGLFDSMKGDATVRAAYMQNTTMGDGIPRGPDYSNPGFLIGRRNMAGAGSDYQWDEIAASMDQALYSAHQGFLDVFEMFGKIDTSLAELGTFELAEGGGAFDEIIERWIKEEIPREVFEQMTAGLEQGLADVGFTDASIDLIFAEAAGMTGQQLMDFMAKIAAGATAIKDAVADVDPDEIERVLNLTALESFADGMGAVFDQIDLLQDRMSVSVSAADQAVTAQRIADLIQSARAAELQMLAQIRAMQDGINTSIASAKEQLLIGGMNDPDKQSYYVDQVSSLFGNFGAGMSPEDIQTNSADLLAYMSQLSSSFANNEGWAPDGLDSEVSDLFDTFTNDYMGNVDDLAAALGIELDPNETLREFFARAYDAIQAASDESFESAEESVKEWADKLSDEALETAASLANLGRAVRDVVAIITDPNDGIISDDPGAGLGSGGGDVGGPLNPGGGAGDNPIDPNGNIFASMHLGKSLSIETPTQDFTGVISSTIDMMQDYTQTMSESMFQAMTRLRPEVYIDITVVNHRDGSTTVSAVPYGNG